MEIRIEAYNDMLTTVNKYGQTIAAQAALIENLGNALKITWEEYKRIFETSDNEIPDGIKEHLAAYEAWKKEQGK